MAGIDPVVNIDDDTTSTAKVLKDGHKGLLSTNTEAKASNVTTIRASYKPPRYHPMKEKGSIYAMLDAH